MTILSPMPRFDVASQLETLSRGWATLQLSVATPERVPSWDALVLTASNEEQAQLYRLQLEAARRSGMIPPATRPLVVPDPQGVRVGSGGATLATLRVLAETLGPDLAQRRVLLVHAGGDSRRVPWASFLGKPFIPLPLLADPDQPVPTLFDHLLAVTAPLALAMQDDGGLVTLSGDVLPLFAAGRLALPAQQALIISTPVSLDLASRHGVVVADEHNRVVDLLQKASPNELARRGALVEGGAALLDTGILAFTGRAFGALATLAAEDDDPVQAIIASGEPCSLYEEIAGAMVPARHEWVRARPLGERLVEALGGVRLHTHRANELRFVHLGTTAEVLGHLERPWDGRLARRVLAEHGTAVDPTAVVLNARLAPGARVGAGSLVYASHLGDSFAVGSRCVVLAVAAGEEPFRLPDNSCLWQIPLRRDDGDGLAFCTVCCGVDDNPKAPFDEASFANRDLRRWLQDHGLSPADLWQPDDERTLWTARLFPVQHAPVSLSLAAWMLGDGHTSARLREAWRQAPRHSLAGLQRAANAAVLLDQREGIAAQLILRALRHAADGALDRNARALGAQLRQDGHRAQVTTMADEVAVPGSVQAHGTPRSRLLQLRADLLQTGGYAAEAQDMAHEAFEAVHDEVAESIKPIANEPVLGLETGRTASVSLPVRFDIAGGWSDTPPYCLERPARVLNLALELNGELPVGAEVEALDAPHWDLEMADSGRRERVTDPATDASGTLLDDPFLLLKTALKLTGYGDDEHIFQGVRVRTWARVPKGSGLGTSSILAAALIKALQRLAGRAEDSERVSDLVLVLEQRMTTGGGWQDQVGGLVPGVKCISSAPVLPLNLRIEQVALLPEVVDELQQRLVVVFTGRERLAKNVLQIVVERYLQRDARVIGAVRRLVELADEGRQALALGDLDGLGLVLSEAWRVHQQLDPHCSNPWVDSLFREVEDLVIGGKLAGAGGGGFMGLLATDAEAAALVRTRMGMLGGGVRVHDWRLWQGAAAAPAQA